MDSHTTSSPSSFDQSRSHDQSASAPALAPAPAELSSPPSSSGNSSDSFPRSQDVSEHGVQFLSQSGAKLDRHPRGRRKRTAAKDKAILEAAYLANPKPDKAARFDIVRRVSLNEREVQIWFQNRRQNDRRKSRPLSPEEIAALRYGGMQILSSDPPIPFDHLPNQGQVDDSATTPPPLPHTTAYITPDGAQLLPPPMSTTPLSSPDLGPWLPERFEMKTEESSLSNQASIEHSGAHTSLGPETPAPPAPSQTPESSSGLPGISQSFSAPVGYLANRWNMQSSFSTPATLNRGGADDSVKLESFALSSCSSTASAPILPPPNSHRPFRLSLSLDGKAEIISGNSPSPPRLPPPRHIDGDDGSPLAAPRFLPAVRRPGLQRSYSALPAITLPPISTLTGCLAGSIGTAVGGGLPPRLTRGRSRDVHAWEFACDAENREDELTVQAQHESSGSAIAAISLLRSTSNTSSSGGSNTGSVLQPNSAKRNASFSRPAQRGQAKKPRLGRASSSVARMQSGTAVSRDDVPPAEKRRKHKLDELVEGGADKENDGADDPKKLKVSTLLLSPSGNDSDKENWSPDEDGNVSRAAARPVSSSSFHLPPTATNSNGRRPLPSGAPRKALPKGGSSHGGNAHPRRTMGRILESHSGPLFLPGGATPVKGAGGAGGSGKTGERLEIYEDEASPPRRPLSRVPRLAPPASSRRGKGEADGDENDEDDPSEEEKEDEEVERFMRGEVSPSKKGDMDCVAGLLSLSQGNWR